MHRKSNILQLEPKGQISSVDKIYTFADYETGKNKPIRPVLILIYREFNVCEDWLLSRTGDMFLSDSESALNILAKRYHLRVKDYMLIKKLLDMGSITRDEIYDYMYDVVKAVQDEDVDPNTSAV